MKKYLDKIGKNSKKASIKSVKTIKKNKVLIDFANLIRKNRTKILYQNKKDQKYATKKGIKNNMIERLILNSARLKQIEKSVIKIANLKDPVDKTLLMWKRPNGLKIKKVTIPIGVIGII
jgi:Gamma-glutamyl phosphate reductase